MYEVRTPFGARSGVAISANGRILTNYQAIADGTVTALLAASSIEPATVVGYNQLLDLVAIEIDPATPVFIPVKLGGRLSLGDEVLAIGFPLGGDLSVIGGIVSGIGAFEDTGVSYIQKDATVNPGNICKPYSAIGP